MFFVGRVLFFNLFFLCIFFLVLDFFLLCIFFVGGVLLFNLYIILIFFVGRVLVFLFIFCMYGMFLKLGIFNVIIGFFVFSWNVYIVKGFIGFKIGDRELLFFNFYKYKDIYIFINIVLN